jgi:hypothetical protein
LCSDFSWPDMTGKLLKTDCVLSTVCSSSMPFCNAKGCGFLFLRSYILVTFSLFLYP